MTRKSFLLALGVTSLLAVIAGALVVLLRHEPDFYQFAVQPPGPDREQKSKEFWGGVSSFYNDMYLPEPRDTPFTEEQINSYLDEDFVKSNLADKILPEGISSPHVAIRPDRIRLAFRYGAGAWSTIVSIDLRVWLPKEPNVVALELKGLHAGSLPISSQSLLERVSETARQQNIDVTWYRHEGNPVALLRFQADQPHPTVQLQRLELRQGLILVRGHSIPDLRAWLPMATKNETN